MSGRLPHRIEAINRLCSRLSAALARSEMKRHERLIAVRFIKEALTRALDDMHEIYPGMDRVAQWGRVKRRQATYDVRLLERDGLLTPVRYAKGGRRATRYLVDPEAIIGMAQDAGAPLPDPLVIEIQDVLDMVAQAGERAGENPAQNPAQNPANVQTVYCRGKSSRAGGGPGASPSQEENVVLFPHRDGGAA